jgi:hypothetical protein
MESTASEPTLWLKQPMCQSLQPAMHKKPPKFRPAPLGTRFGEGEQHKYGLGKKPAKCIRLGRHKTSCRSCLATESLRCTV